MRRTGAMADDSVHHTVNGTVDLSEEESVSREISELLESLERSNAAQLLETTFRPKLAAASSKLTALYEENARRIAAALEDSNTKIPNMPLYDSAEANSSAQKSDMLYNLMMQKRLNNMKRSLELADLKARSVTNQW